MVSTTKPAELDRDSSSARPILRELLVLTGLHGLR